VSTPKIQRTMNFAAAALIVAAVLVGLWGAVVDGPDLPRGDGLGSRFESAGDSPSSSTRTAAPPVATDVTAESDLWSRPLQRGFRAKAMVKVTPPVAPVIAAAQVASVAPQVVPDLGIRLVGTVMESGRSLAIVIDRQGKLDFRSEGDSLQLEPTGIRVESVSNDSVRVTFQGQSSTWMLGQWLSFAGESAASSQATPVLPVVPQRPKMSVEQELELINAAPSDNPL
jgi:hypothetical protein